MENCLNAVSLFALAACTLALGGCLSPTQSIVREYSDAGALMRETITNESVLKTVMESTKHKVVFVNDQSWLAGVRAIPPGSSAENPAGVLEMLAGKRDITMLTVPAKQANITPATARGIATLIEAARAGDITLGAEGVSSTSGAAAP